MCGRQAVHLCWAEKGGGGAPAAPVVVHAMLAVEGGRWYSGVVPLFLYTSNYKQIICFPRFPRALFSHVPAAGHKLSEVQSCTDLPEHPLITCHRCQ